MLDDKSEVDIEIDKDKVEALATFIYGVDNHLLLEDKELLFILAAKNKEEYLNTC